MKFLNLGCGNNYHKDWINIDFATRSDDVIEHNLLKGIPLADDSIDVLYHSHVLEHFSKKDGEELMKECNRVLKDNGIIRVAVPDLETIAVEYLRNLNLALEGDKDAIHNYEWIQLELFDQMVRNKSGGEMGKYLQQASIPNEEYVFQRIGLEGKYIREDFLSRQNKKAPVRTNSVYKPSKKKLFKKFIKSSLLKIFKKLKLQEPIPDLKIVNTGKFRCSGEIHQWMYDRFSLTELFKRSGFQDIRICNAYESSIPNWSDYNLDVVKGEIRKPDSLFVEGRKS
ncbi:methyltransferase domain-containing protein [Salegentibacter sp. LM13S]|uniref:class I SAM-dependent methyltransferase n=1 Tax=Salegentibacter lacus TaxID=2873599 RepID=UPI001CCBBB51|nr:methyltransferase domain-containing protein [Salegentibacter lacus]MBZ9632352.1 methyltransferase domain-containing protein [Salegentibacter lacus]